MISPARTEPHRTTTPRTRRVLATLLSGLILVLVAGGCSGDAPAGAAAPVETPVETHADTHTDTLTTTTAEAHDTAAHPVALAADAPLPGASLYHLDASWTDHRGETLLLEDLRGRPVVVVMIYANCETACPILVRDALRLDAALPADVREATRVLLVTFDTENDAPERLASYVEDNDLDDPRWRFAVGDAHGTRALAAMLGVRYRPAGNGMFSHSNLITVLGAEGVPLARAEGLGMPHEPLVEALAGAVR